MVLKREITVQLQGRVAGSNWLRAGPGSAGRGGPKRNQTSFCLELDTFDMAPMVGLPRNQ